LEGGQGISDGDEVQAQGETPVMDVQSYRATFNRVSTRPTPESLASLGSFRWIGAWPVEGWARQRSWLLGRFRAITGQSGVDPE
jgi:hypothetical protein